MKKEYFKEMCDPDIYFVQYCRDFVFEPCSKTCHYAQLKIPFLERVVKEDFDF